MPTRTALLAALLLAACAQNTSLTTAWHDRDIVAGPYKRILVVGASRNLDRREDLEDALAEAVSDRHTRAWSSIDFMPPDRPLNRTTVGRVVQSSGADAVLVVRLVRRVVKPAEVPERVDIRTQHRSDNIYDFFSYEYKEYREPGYLVARHTIELAVDVYDVKTARLIYTVRSITTDVGSETDLLDEATGAISRQLHRDAFIR